MPEKKPRKRIPKKASSLQEVKEIVPDALSGMSWPDACAAAKTTGSYIRRKAWTGGEFMFYRQPASKLLTSETPPDTFYKPITKEFLEARGLKKFYISGHFNKWTKNNNIMVGAFPTVDDRSACDWETIEL